METIEQYKQKIKELEEENQRLRMLLNLSLKRGCSNEVSEGNVYDSNSKSHIIQREITKNWPISFLVCFGEEKMRMLYALTKRQVVKQRIILSVSIFINQVAFA